MSHQVLDNIVSLADDLRSRPEQAESLGQLSDEMAKGLKHSGIIRMFARKKYDGFEAHPRDFAEAVTKTASIYGSAGWVSGIVGVHPWQLAIGDGGSEGSGGDSRFRQ